MRFRVNEPAVIHQAIDGELVIIHLDNGVYYSCDASGARIWSQLSQGTSVDSTIQDIAAETSTERSEVETSVRGFVERLIAEDLIVSGVAETASDDVADGGSPTAAPGPDPSADRQPFSVPVLQRYEDLQDLLLLDPIHAVDESGWPDRPDSA